MVDNFSREVDSALDETVKKLARHRIDIVIVVDVPEIGYNVSYALAKTAWQGSAIGVAMSRTEVRERQAKVMAMLGELPPKCGAEAFDPTLGPCDATECRVECGACLICIDALRLSEYGERSISYLYTASLSAGLQKPG